MIFKRKREGEEGLGPVHYAELLRTLSEVKNVLSTLLARLAKLDENLSDISMRLSNLEKLIGGTFLIQLGGVPSSLEDLVRLLNLRGAVLLRGGREIERYGEIRLNYSDVVSNIDFSTVLMLDQDGVFAYALRDGDKILYVESSYPLDLYTISYLRKYLRFA